MAEKEKAYFVDDDHDLFVEAHLVVPLYHLVPDDGPLIDQRSPTRAFMYVYKREDGGPQGHGSYARSMVNLFDARGTEGSLTLDRNGLAFVSHNSALSTADFYEDTEKITSVYYKEMEELVMRATGASKVVVFDHNVRNLEEARRRKRLQGKEREMHDASKTPMIQGYAVRSDGGGHVHNDYNTRSAPQRIRDLAKPTGQGGSYTLTEKPLLEAPEVPSLLENRFIFINVWRNISDASPILQHPLVVLDGASTQPEHFMDHSLIYPDRVGGDLRMHHHEEHRWIYFSRMRKEEAILLKVMDSAGDQGGICRYTCHAAIEDPTAPSDAPPRESIEARCIAFFKPTDEGRTHLPGLAGAAAAAKL